MHVHVQEFELESLRQQLEEARRTTTTTGVGAGRVLQQREREYTEQQQQQQAWQTPAPTPTPTQVQAEQRLMSPNRPLGPSVDQGQRRPRTPRGVVGATRAAVSGVAATPSPTPSPRRQLGGLLSAADGPRSDVPRSQYLDKQVAPLVLEIAKHLQTSEPHSLGLKHAIVQYLDIATDGTTPAPAGTAGGAAEDSDSNSMAQLALSQEAVMILNGLTAKAEDERPTDVRAFFRAALRSDLDII